MTKAPTPTESLTNYKYTRKKLNQNKVYESVLIDDFLYLYSEMNWLWLNLSPMFNIRIKKINFSKRIELLILCTFYHVLLKTSIHSIKFSRLVVYFIFNALSHEKALGVQRSIFVFEWCLHVSPSQWFFFGFGNFCHFVSSKRYSVWYVLNL